MAAKHAKRTNDEQPVAAESTSQSDPPPAVPAVPAATEPEAMPSQTFLELAPDAMLVVDAAGQIVQLNHQTEVLFAYPRAELIGKAIEVLLPGRFQTAHVRHRSAYTADPRMRPMGTNLPLFGRRKDGSEFPVEVSLSPVRIGEDLFIISSIRDITERRRLEAAERVAHAAIDRQRRLLQTLLDQLPGGAYLVRGADAELVLANQAAEQVWGAVWRIGQPMAEFLRTSGLRYFTESGVPMTIEQLYTMQILRGTSAVHQHRQVIRRSDGVYLPILLSAVGIDVSLLDEPAASATSSDAATTVVPPDEPPRAALVLLQDISAIQAAEKLKDEFVSLAAHELRTPLTGLLGFASMLRVQTANGHGPALDDWQEEAIAEIEHGANRLNELVTDLTDTTRIQADRLMLHLTPLDLVVTVRRSLQRVQVTTERHTLTLDAPSEPVLIEADGLRLEQVFGNLLNNAVKYSPNGGAIAVAVRVDHERQVAEVRIRDHGIGIPAEDQVHLFQRFARARNVHERQIPGTGLGLYVCRAIVERHGGQIWFESAEGHGATFFVTFPLLSATDAATDGDANGDTNGDVGN